jgi:hypothetical protein
MTTNCTRVAVAAAALILFPGGTLYAETLPFGVFGFPIDISANVKDTLLPSGTILFQDSKPLFDTVQGESTDLLHISTGVNASGRSTNISGAFTSSQTGADGSGGAGVSQLIFGSPGGSGQDVVRQLVAESLWTQTFTYTGTFPVDLTLHLHIPSVQVGLLGVPPRRSSPSDTETANAGAFLDSLITHPDGTISKGGSLDFGMSLGEVQVASGMDLLNLADLELLGQTGKFAKAPRFNGDDFNPSYIIDAVSIDVDLGTLHKGDIMSYVYTLTAAGTTHGFERGYFAFVGDPFGGELISDNLGVTVRLVDEATTPEASTSALLLLGFAGLLAWHRHRLRLG